MADHLQNLIDSFLTSHPKVSFDKGNYALSFTKSSVDGFSIWLNISPTDDIIFLTTDCGFKRHYHMGLFASQTVALKTVLGILDDAIKGHARLKVTYRNEKPVKWEMEIKSKEHWITSHSSGSFFKNIFGKKTEKIFAN